MTLNLEGVESPHQMHSFWTSILHSTILPLRIFWKFESCCFQLYRAQLSVIGSGNKCFACMGSGISTWILFFQGLCETSNHSAWTKAVHVKRKAPLFGCTVFLCWMAGSVAGILGYLIKLWCYFSDVSIKAACYGYMP
jgi:hypothetical protein